MAQSSSTNNWSGLVYNSLHFEQYVGTIDVMLVIQCVQDVSDLCVRSKLDIRHTAGTLILEYIYWVMQWQTNISNKDLESLESTPTYFPCHSLDTTLQHPLGAPIIPTLLFKLISIILIPTNIIGPGTPDHCTFDRYYWWRYCMSQSCSWLVLRHLWMNILSNINDAASRFARREVKVRIALWHDMHHNNA